MMTTRVAANGDISEPAEFTAQNDGANEADAEWVAWNTKRDSGEDKAQ